jgi:hypothetical protein
MATTVRNIVIVLAIAALIVLIPGGGSGGTFALQAVSLVFLGVIGWFAYVSYREHKMSLYSLGTAKRGILYGAVGVIILTLAASDRLLHHASAAGKLAWILLLIGSAYAVFSVIWSARKY